MSGIKNSRVRAGVTLVELLVVIAVLGTISGMFAYAYRGAQQESLTQKTRATVGKIAQVIESIYPDYANEPLGVPFDGAWDNWTSANWTFPVNPPTNRSIRIERTKLLLVRDRLRFEMPDCADDLKWTRSRVAAISRIGLGPSPDAFIRRVCLTVRSEMSQMANPALSPRAIRLMRKLSHLDGGYYVPNPTPGVDWELTNANAELLYLIVEDALLDGASALELFGPSEIADLDGDGLNEFVDAWRNPIGWLRWPSGSNDAVFSHPDPLDPLLVQNGRLTIGDEPYDELGSDPGLGTLNTPLPLGMPIVISAGSDRSFGVRLELDPIPESELRTIPVSLRPVFADSKSSADCIWYSSLNNPPQTSWLPVGRNFADPWYPRETARRLGRLGAELNPSEASDNINSAQGTGASL